MGSFVYDYYYITNYKEYNMSVAEKLAQLKEILEFYANGDNLKVFSGIFPFTKVIEDIDEGEAAEDGLLLVEEIIEMLGVDQVDDPDY